MSEAPLLEVRDLRVTYGNVQAVRGLSLSVRAGQIVTLIGPNGAGKSSTLAAVSGLVRPEGGQIALAGRDVTGLAAHQAVAQGIVLVPEGRAILARMSIEENLVVALESRSPMPPAQARAMLEDQYRRFPVLGERRRLAAGSLSGGEQQMLAIARALLMRPDILLLDEPSMGLAPVLVEKSFEIIEQVHAAGVAMLVVELIFETIEKLHEAGITILLVEQNAHMALSIADRGYVLETGQIKLTGPGKELLANEDVRKAYLGE
jgi:branched-chain amino acid transport system ATP-binding protein